MANRLKLTPENETEIVQRYTDRWHPESARVLAEDFCVSHERIYQVLRKHKVSMHQPHEYGDYAHNGRKCYEPRESVTIDTVLSRLSA